jgi:hypothetical protein
MALALVLVAAFFGLILLIDIVDDACQPRLGNWLLIVGLSSAVILVLGIPVGIHMIARNFGDGNPLWVWTGFALIAGGIGVVEFVRSNLHRELQNDRLTGFRTEAGKQRFVRDLRWMQVFILVSLQLIAVLKFALIMDGGLRFRACRHVYLYYAVCAILIVALRWRSWTRLERIFLCWGWAPIVAFGVPLLIDEWKATGQYQILL